MASGLPDYQKEIRPRYGGAQRQTDTVCVNPDLVTELLAITGKGMIYGGVVFLEPGASQVNSMVYLFVDGKWIGGMSFAKLNKYGINKPQVYPSFELKYDTVNHIYCCGISPGITFESSFQLKYFEWHGNNPSVIFDVYYTLIG